MSRYIDAEWLLNFFEPYPNDYQTPLGSLRACVDDAPSIEIIRCGECKYYLPMQKNLPYAMRRCYCNKGAIKATNPDDFCSYGCRDSEKPNNCEHITEDGVTCAKYPACDDCLDNPLNKVKGSERLVKGSEQTDCPTCRWWSSYGYCVHRECKGYEPQTERSE